MDLQEILLSACVGLLAFFIIKKYFEFKDFPPGPWGVPFLGYLPFIVFKNPFKVFENFKLKYGKVFSLKLGSFRVVVINDYKLIMEAFKEDVFTGRPAFDVQMTRNHGKKRGLLFSDGTTWMEQRRFAIRNLRILGLGKQSMECSIQHEARELVNFFNENVGKAIQLKNKFNASVLNSLWYIVTGDRFDINDPNFLFMIDMLINNMQQVELTGVAFYFPWILKNTDIAAKGFWKRFIESRDRIQGLIRKTIEEHKATFDPSVQRDFVDALIGQWKKTDDPQSSFYKDEGDMNMLIVVVDLFLAGAETTSSTLQWAMLYMIMFEDVQKKVHQEIDAVVGSNREPCLDDRPNMLYTEATLYEIHRFCSLLPFAVSHAATEDVTFAGFKIPKGTNILANLRGAHYDEGYWGDPESFRPERFIDTQTQKIIKHDAFMPFSTGKRTCLGDSMAKDSLFIFFTSLMQKFRVEKDPDSGPLSLEVNAPTFIVAPKPFKIVIRPRL